MPYWFEDPMLRSLAPLALSTSIKGLTTIFNVPKMFVGANVFPSGVAIGVSGEAHTAAPSTQLRSSVSGSASVQKGPGIVPSAQAVPAQEQSSGSVESQGLRTQVCTTEPSISSVSTQSSPG